MLVAAHRLAHRCDLAHMAGLGSLLRWYWRAAYISTVLLVIPAILQIVASFRLSGALAAAPNRLSEITAPR